MKRFLLYLLGIFLLLFSAAHACNFKIYNFGDSAEKSQETSFKKMGKPDPYGGLKIQFHAELICKEKSFENTLLKYFFVEDKVKTIQKYFFPDDTHWNEEGHKLIYEKIFEEIKKINF